MLENTPSTHEEFAPIQVVYTKIKREADAINEKEKEIQSRGIMLEFRQKLLRSPRVDPSKVCHEQCVPLLYSVG